MEASEKARYQRISYASETSPAIPATQRASRKASVGVAAGASTTGAGAALACCLGSVKCRIRTVIPTIALIAAASITEPDSPKRYIRKTTAQKHAVAEPSVFTKYSEPTERPTLPEMRTR